MAYSTPLTAVSGTALTAAQWNASMRDDMLVTPAALATAAGRIFVSTGANAIAERVIDSATVATSQTTASTTYADLATAGPSVTVTTGTQALVFVTCQLSNNSGVNQRALAAVAVSGATTYAANDVDAIRYQVFGSNADHRGTSAVLFKALTAGSNTFKMQYRVDGGTGSFSNRHLCVIAL
jgi:hypothetical protein